MSIVIATVVLYAFLESLMVGLSFAAVSHRFAVQPSVPRSFLALFPVFFLLAVYYIPGIETLDAKLVIGNQEIAQEIGPGTPIVLREFFRLGISDPIVWGVQAAIAAAVARWSIRSTSRPRRRSADLE